MHAEAVHPTAANCGRTTRRDDCVCVRACVSLDSLTVGTKANSTTDNLDSLTAGTKANSTTDSCLIYQALHGPECTARLDIADGHTFDGWS